MIINKKASVPILIFLFIMFVALWLDITLISYSPVNTPKDKPVALNTPKTTIKPKGDEKEDKTKPTISPPNRFTLDTIYFNFDGLSEQGKKYINGIIEAKNTNSYNKSLKDKKTEVRFYGFAGALKYAPNLATGFDGGIWLNHGTGKIQAPELQRVILHIGLHGIIKMNGSGQDLLGKGILHLPLNHSAERPGAKVHVKACLGQIMNGILRNGQANAPLFKPLGDRPKQKPGNLIHILLG